MQHAMVRRPVTTDSHTTSYLQAGPLGGPLLIFAHGWPGLGVTWRHQLAHFAARGFRVVAPDLRGYGNSTGYADPSAYRQELIVGDMLALQDHPGGGSERYPEETYPHGQFGYMVFYERHPDRITAVFDASRLPRRSTSIWRTGSPAGY